MWSSLGLHPKAKGYREEEEKSEQPSPQPVETKPNISPLLFSKSLSILTIGGPGGAKTCSGRRLALYGVGKQAVIKIKLEITEETLMMWKNINKRLSSEGSYNIACMFGCVL